MTSPRDIRMLTRYSQWANQNLYAALAALPEPLLQQPQPGRATGMAGTLGHNVVVDRIWQAHLQGQAHSYTERVLPAPASLAELKRWQLELDAWYVAYADENAATDLEEAIDFHFVDGGPGRMRRGDILLHTINHKTYHRGYVASMLYDAGYKPPTIDLSVFLRDAHAQTEH
jgi:uncharacterized damage-inducible protein DinB